MKRFVRSPWLWIVVAVAGVLVVLQYAANPAQSEVETSKMVDYITSGEVKEITFVDGGDQQIRAKLDNGKEVISTWVTGQQIRLVRQVQKQVDAGEIEKFNVENPKPSIIGSLLSFLLPIIIIIAVFLFFMNQMQGGGRG